jgi:putative sterol carrier protein
VSVNVREFFESFESRVDPSRTAGMTNTYVFDIDGAGQWTVAVDDGEVAVSEGASADADCTLRSSEESFERIVSGELNPTSAYMTGKLKIKGDMGAAMRLQKLL